MTNQFMIASAVTSSLVLPYTVVTSDNFPGGTITFDLQTRFEESSSLKQFTIPNEAERDFASFVEIVPSTQTPTYYSVLMITPLYRHDIEGSVINSQFSELINA